MYNNLPNSKLKPPLTKYTRIQSYINQDFNCTLSVLLSNNIFGWNLKPRRRCNWVNSPLPIVPCASFRRVASASKLASVCGMTFARSKHAMDTKESVSRPEPLFVTLRHTGHGFQAADPFAIATIVSASASETNALMRANKRHSPPHAKIKCTPASLKL